MGISGLLPLLKDIQVNKHLSEFAGKTVAVDAYVWLHRGTYGCAPDLATGKNTTKYVEYAMHRVRLLRHHGIQPYIVFDGGPLPAKKGTESERKKKRDEHLARAHALAAQGKHAQAREYYVKCIDVTPQMAFQLIKALRAEAVPYVVAPYEADAQLAYLERTGRADAVLTEDSDLLVFGCRTVLFKLDAVAATVTCIARADFAAVAAASPGALSLLGWSDVQFRHMAILSGCDYLPSIPGVGLKTAWALLRRCKTVEGVVRALNLEGKKKVPRGYLEAFRLAEQVFLYQRVYDPALQRLVHLAEVPRDEEWNEEQEAYVGATLEPSLAKQVAEGDACPITLLPMEDINPAFVPRALKALPMSTRGSNVPDRDKRKAAEKPPAGILQFFTPRADAPAPPKDCAQMNGTPHPRGGTTPAPAAGRASGKRTLAEVMDQESAAKRKKQEDASPARVTSSRFFCGAAAPPRPPGGSADGNGCASAGPSRLAYAEAEKENVPEDDDIFTGGPSAVTQEDGYISPAPSLREWDSSELSSPVRAGARRAGDGDDDFGADVLSSPPIARSRARRLTRAASGGGSADAGGAERGLVRGSPARPEREEAQEAGSLGPDLRDAFDDWDWDDVTSDIECGDAERSAASSPGPVTPDDSLEQIEGGAVICGGGDAEAVVEDVMDVQAAAARNERVASGWWEKWARSGADSSSERHVSLRRRETTMTADGRQRPLQWRPHSAQPSWKRTGVQQDLRSAGRRSLVFTEEAKTAPRGSVLGDASCARAGSGGPGREDGGEVGAKNRLAGFRYAGG